MPYTDPGPPVYDKFDIGCPTLTSLGLLISNNSSTSQTKTQSVVASFQQLFLISYIGIYYN